MTDKCNPRFTQDGLTVAHLQGGLLQKGLTVGHLAQALSGGATQGQSGNTPAASAPTGGIAPAPAATTQKP